MVTIQHSHQYEAMQFEHRTTDASDYRVDAAAAATRYFDLRVHARKRLIRVTSQPVNGNGGSGEFHYLRKIVRPYGTWRASAATIGEALSAGELTGVSLDSEGSANRNNIRVGTILRITGVVAGDTPDRVVMMVVRVTAITLSAGVADTIDFEHIWTSVSRACDTAATLEIYDTTVADGSRMSEDIWKDVSPDALTDEALDDDEGDITMSGEGVAAAAGIVAGSIVRVTATDSDSSTVETEIMLVTSITLSGGNPDVINVIRGYWGTIGRNFDDDATKLEVLNGRITDLKALSGVADNTRYEPATYDDDFLDFEENAYLRSIAVGGAETRHTAFFVQRD